MSVAAQEMADRGTASPEEIAHFTTLASSWWDPKGDFKSLHQINPVRLMYIRDKLTAHFYRDPKNIRSLEGLSVIDIGCGGGLICEPMARLGANVTGLDATTESIEVADLHARQSELTINYINELPEDTVARGETFDVVINMEVIEHVADVGAFMAACAALLKPGGIMVASTLNRTLKSLALAKIGAEYVLRWVPAGTHDWRKFVKPSEFGRVLRGSRLELLDITGMSFDPLSRSWRLSENLDINYFITAQKKEFR